MFWHARFMVEVCSELVLWAFPFLPTLRANVEQLGSEAGPSMKAVVKALEFLGVVAIQDALELVDKYSSHPVHIRLMGNDRFR